MSLQDGIIEGWIAEGEQRGWERGVAKGKAKATRKLSLHVLSVRLGELPNALIERIESGDPEWCIGLVDQALKIKSLSELDWNS